MASKVHVILRQNCHVNSMRDKNLICGACDIMKQHKVNFNTILNISGLLGVPKLQNLSNSA